MKFSVLMTVYCKENPDNLRESLNSILVEQTRLPDQFVLVYDGPVGKELSDVTESFRESFPNEYIIIKLPDNRGQGAASNAGLKQCKYGLIARMDSDDISYPDRFESELAVFEKDEAIDAVGGYITEFQGDPKNITGVRIVAEKHEEIKSKFKHRMGMNNVTVMLKKEAIEKIGGYSEERNNEDFNLYVRLLLANKTFYNIQRPMVNVRVGDNMLERRGDIGIYHAWKKNQKLLYEGGITNKLEYYINCAACYCFVKCPKGLKQILYKVILRRRI